MRNVIIGLMVLLLALPLMSGAAHASVNPKLVIDSYTISEVPSSPGHDVTLKINLKNIDSYNCANRVFVQLASSYPASVDGKDTQYIGTICPDESKEVSYTLSIDSLARFGTYPISVLTTYEKTYDKFSDSNIINLRVGGEPSFTASVSSSKPVDIYPGDVAAITIKFQNNGAGNADSVRAKLTAPPGIEVKWSGSEQELGTIPARASTSATFQIEAGKNTPAETYELNVTLDYLSQDKEQGSQILSFEMPLREKADFSADTKENKPLVSGDDREIRIFLKNTGSEVARNLKVRLMPIFPFSTDGTVRYLDSLKPGEDKLIIYQIHIDSEATPGEQTVGLLIEFENLQGKKYTDSIDVPLSIEARTLDYYVAGYGPWIAVLLAIVVALIIRRRISQNKEKK